MHTTLLLDMMADAAPGRLAFGRRGEGVTFQTIQRRARNAAAWLPTAGDVVAFLGLNGAALPVALFAAGMLGKPFAPLNYRLPDGEIRRLLARTAPSMAIVDDDMLDRVGQVPGVTLVARSQFERACDQESLRAPSPCDGQEAAIQLFTSGTTGEPKAAILKHQNLTAYVISSVEFLGADETDAALISVPPYHIAGVAAILTGVYSGRRVVHLDAFTPEGWVATAAVEGVTHAMVVPTMLGRILDVLEGAGETLPDLKAISYGGGRMPLPVIERAMQLLPHVAFANAYGLTETSSTISILGPEDHRQAITSSDPAVRRRLSSVGKPLPFLDVEIRGPAGEVLPPGRSGEIHVRGDQVSGEYSHKKMVGADGWFPTNDGGWLDEDGYLYVEGRLDDVIVRGGENISPGEIEDVLRQHPGVADVAVLGVQDDDWGERIAAVVVAKDSPPLPEELAAWVKARLRSTKTPDIWEYRAALPYNDTGKLLRRELRSEMGQRGA